MVDKALPCHFGSVFGVGIQSQESGWLGSGPDAYFDAFRGRVLTNGLQPRSIVLRSRCTGHFLESNVLVPKGKPVQVNPWFFVFSSSVFPGLDRDSNVHPSDSSDFHHPSDRWRRPWKPSRKRPICFRAWLGAQPGDGSEGLIPEGWVFAPTFWRSG